ncbi:MAG: hypothetical protein RLZZ69_3315 [Cyanobacteriota bacterium]
MQSPCIASSPCIAVIGGRQSPKLEAHSVKVIKSRTDLDLKLQQKDSELEFVDKVEVTQIAEIESAEKIKQTEVEVEDNWQPDLSGWSVFKGLSK